MPLRTRVLVLVRSAMHRGHAMTTHQRVARWLDTGNLYTRLALSYHRIGQRCHAKDPRREVYAALSAKAAKNARWYIKNARDWREHGWTA